MGSAAMRSRNFSHSGRGKQHQTTVRMLGDRQLAASGRAQHVTMPCRHGKPTLLHPDSAMKPLETPQSTLFALAKTQSKRHFSPLNCTFLHCIRKIQTCKGLATIFCNEIKDLEAFSYPTAVEKPF
jgi:hypothetical protein